MRHKTLEGTSTNLCRCHIYTLGYARIVSGVLQHPYHCEFKQYCFPASGGGCRYVSGIIRTAGMNQPTGYNLMDEVSNGGADELPLSYRVLRGVHQLDGELKASG
jgi:hypothetical protein